MIETASREHIDPDSLASLGIVLFGVGWWLEAAFPGLGTTRWQLLGWGLFVITMLLCHVTFLGNSVTHMWGRRRYATKDHSRNKVLEKVGLVWDLRERGSSPRPGLEEPVPGCADHRAPQTSRQRDRTPHLEEERGRAVHPHRDRRRACVADSDAQLH